MNIYIYIRGTYCDDMYPIVAQRKQLAGWLTQDNNYKETRVRQNSIQYNCSGNRRLFFELSKSALMRATTIGAFVLPSYL